MVVIKACQLVEWPQGGAGSMNLYRRYEEGFLGSPNPNNATEKFLSNFHHKLVLFWHFDQKNTVASKEGRKVASSTDGRPANY